MKSGDLVKMMYTSFWMRRKKSPKTRIPYTDAPLLVLESYENAVKVMMPDGQVKTDLAECYEVISECV